MKEVCLALVLVCLALGVQGAPRSPAELADHSQLDLLEFDEDAILDSKDVWLTEVPCDFCNDSIPLVLEICRGSGGRSTEHVEDFLTKCTNLGGMNPTKLELMMGTCVHGGDDEQARVNFIYDRRHRCAKIYRGLVKMYDPFDPCVQILHDFQHNPMTVCKSADIDCKAGGPKVPDYMIPPFKTNASIEYQPPPRRCEEYVNVATKACAQLKSDNFYARSNLDGWCLHKFNGTYERLGCQKIVSTMTERDTLMDLCSGLKIFPLEVDFGTYCNQTLSVHPGIPVPLEEYDHYMFTVENVGKMSEYLRLLNASTPVPARGTLLLP